MMNNTQVHVFTSAALNYIPKVRILFNSIKKFHPDWKLHLALADKKDEDFDLSDEIFDSVYSVAELDIPDYESWAFKHSIVELATAIKPFMFLKLFKLSNCQKVIYLDPDIVVFSQLDDILDYLDEYNILLTPHLVEPDKTIEAIMDNEISCLKHGIYNLGFLGLSNKSETIKFLNWWSDRLYHFCRDDIPNGLFTDQRWIDFVPAFFEGVNVLKSPRFNVATWNLNSRFVSISGNQEYYVNKNEKLGFYHFTGFDSGAHQVMSKKNANNNPTINKLVTWYKKSINSTLKDPLTKKLWSYANYTNGDKIEKIHRKIYSERHDLQKAFPDPFDSNGFLSWVKYQGPLEYDIVVDYSSIKSKRSSIFLKILHKLKVIFRS